MILSTQSRELSSLFVSSKLSARRQWELGWRENWLENLWLYNEFIEVLSTCLGELDVKPSEMIITNSLWWGGRMRVSGSRMGSKMLTLWHRRMVGSRGEFNRCVWHSLMVEGGLTDWLRSAFCCFCLSTNSLHCVEWSCYCHRHMCVRSGSTQNRSNL